MHRRTIFLILAVMLFLASMAAVMISLERGSRTIAVVGAIGNLIAGFLFVLSMLNPRGKVDWGRIEVEQRLWESGPLGRRWLRVRRRIYERWKL